MAGEPDLTVKEIADHLRIHADTVRKHIDAGDFPHSYLISKRSGWRIPVEDLQAFKDKLRREK